MAYLQATRPDDTGDPFARSDVLYVTVLCMTVLYVTVLYVTVLFVTVLYVTVLHVTVLYVKYSRICHIRAANVSHIRQSRPDSGRSFQVETFQVVILSLGSGRSSHFSVFLSSETPGTFSQGASADEGGRHFSTAFVCKNGSSPGHNLAPTGVVCSESRQFRETFCIV